MRPDRDRTALGGRSPALAAALAAALALALLAGCATAEKDKRQIALQATVSGYESAIRWGYFDTAFGFLHPDLRKGKTLPDSFKDLRLTGYDPIQPPLIQEDDTATQVVVIDYLYEDRQVVKQLTDRQVWAWDPELKSWWLKSGLPAFK
jgi:hypothetical protein